MREIYHRDQQNSAEKIHVFTNVDQHKFPHLVFYIWLFNDSKVAKIYFSPPFRSIRLHVQRWLGIHTTLLKQALNFEKNYLFICLFMGNILFPKRANSRKSLIFFLAGSWGEPVGPAARNEPWRQLSIQDRLLPPFFWKSCSKSQWKFMKFCSSIRWVQKWAVPYCFLI